MLRDYESVFFFELAFEGDVVDVVSHDVRVVAIHQIFFVQESDYQCLQLQTCSESYHHVHDQVPVFMAKK